MHTHLTARPAEPAEREDIARLALSNEMFAPDELGGVLEAFDGALDGTLEDHHWLVLVDTAGVVVGGAYYAPEPFADRVWNLYFIAVAPDGHGAGAGTVLIGHVEDALRSRGESDARVLLVETSGTDQYRQARAFYLARGFAEEARIREYYGPGDDKIVFWKSLVQERI